LSLFLLLFAKRLADAAEFWLNWCLPLELE